MTRGGGKVFIRKSTAEGSDEKCMKPPSFNDTGKIILIANNQTASLCDKLCSNNVLCDSFQFDTANKTCLLLRPGCSQTICKVFDFFTTSDRVLKEPDFSPGNCTHLEKEQKNQTIIDKCAKLQYFNCRDKDNGC